MGTGEDTERAFAARMLAERKRRGWTLEDMAGRVAEHGVSLHKSAFAKIELGTRMVRLGDAQAIADAFGLPLGSMLVTAGAEMERELEETQARLVKAAAASDDALADVAAAMNRRRELVFALLAGEAEHGSR